MSSREQKQQQKTDLNKPRFQIEKLEERIAPHHSRGHYYHGRGYNQGGGGGGNCGHGACK